MSFLRVCANQQVHVRTVAVSDGVGGLLVENNAERAQPDERIAVRRCAEVDAGQARHDVHETLVADLSERLRARRYA